MSYSGWTNYETWAVALWVDNEEGSYLARREIVQAHDKDDLEAGRIAEALKDWVVEWQALPEEASLASDLLSSALSEVNWQELAEHWWEEEDHEEEEPEEEEDHDLPLEA